MMNNLSGKLYIRNCIIVDNHATKYDNKRRRSKKLYTMNAFRL